MGQDQRMDNGLVLNQDVARLRSPSEDGRMDQDLVLNQDGNDGRMDQDHG